MIRSLYVHFPFCESKCHYCDFYSLGREKTQATDASRFESALKREAERCAPQLAQHLDTIFLGGGTPSMTPASSMEKALKPVLRLSQNYEWTMEANPSSITLEAMKDYRSLGVNRVSIGVQSTQGWLLKKFGRVHSREQAFQALGAVFEAGIENVSVDVLCGAPGQTLAHLEETLTELNHFPISHLSCYLLTLSERHPMHVELPDEEEQLRHLLFLHDWMAHNGFRHYEISNFCKPGKEAQHNLQYWKGAPYLGLGPSAHSFNNNERWKNVSSLHKYCERLEGDSSPIEWTETLTPEQQNLERWMLALRLDEGFPSSWLDTEQRRRRAATLESAGYLETHPAEPTRKRLSPRGFALSDQIVAQLA